MKDGSAAAESILAQCLRHHCFYSSALDARNKKILIMNKFRQSLLPQTPPINLKFNSTLSIAKCYLYILKIINWDAPHAIVVTGNMTAECYTVAARWTINNFTQYNFHIFTHERLTSLMPERHLLAQCCPLAPWTNANSMRHFVAFLREEHTTRNFGLESEIVFTISRRFLGTTLRMFRFLMEYVVILKRKK